MFRKLVLLPFSLPDIRWLETLTNRLIAMNPPAFCLQMEAVKCPPKIVSVALIKFLQISYDY